MENPFSLRKAFSNPGLKLLGLFLAVLLWFHVATNKDYEIDVSYAFDYVNLPDSLIIAAQPPEWTTVRQQGSGKLLIRMLWQNRTWSVDLSNAHVGTNTIQLSRFDVPLFGLEGIQVVDLGQYDSLPLVIDSLGMKWVPIVSDLVWEVAPGYVRMGGEQWEPDSASLEGPTKTLRRISEVRSAPVEIRNQSEPVDREVDLVAPGNYAVRMTPLRVRLQQDIEPFIQQEFTNLNVVVATHSTRDTSTVVPPTVSVEVGGPQSAMHQLIPDSISVVCVVAAQDTTGQRRSLWVSVPEPLQVLKTDPDSVTVWRHDRTRTHSRN